MGKYTKRNLFSLVVVDILLSWDFWFILSKRLDIKYM